jgi:hypothetical protein
MRGLRNWAAAWPLLLITSIVVGASSAGAGEYLAGANLNRPSGDLLVSDGDTGIPEPPMSGLPPRAGGDKSGVRAPAAPPETKDFVAPPEKKDSVARKDKKAAGASLDKTGALLLPDKNAGESSSRPVAAKAARAAEAVSPGVPNSIRLPRPAAASEPPPRDGDEEDCVLPPVGDCRACPALDGCCPQCGIPGRLWFQSDYLLWWSKGDRLPALVTVQEASAGLLPQTAFGDSVVESGHHAGVLSTAGLWLDCCKTWALEGGYFELARRNENYDSGLSNGYPVIYRPFSDPDGTPDQRYIAYPTGDGIISGTGRVTVATSDYFQSANIAFRRALYRCDGVYAGDGCDWACCPQRHVEINAILGYRFARLIDGVDIHDATTSTAPDTLNNYSEAEDSFKANNNFHGGELGLDTTFNLGRWSLDVVTQVAMGSNHEVVDIVGRTTTVDNTGVPAVVPGGLLAQTVSNMGGHSQNRFAAIPQLTVQAGFQVTPHLKISAGYDLLYWTNVARAGEQIDTTVDPGNVPNSGVAPTTTHPDFVFRETSYWAEGLRLGGELRY